MQHHSIDLQLQTLQNSQHLPQQQDMKLKTQIPIKEKTNSNKYFFLQSGIILQKPQKKSNSVKFPSLNNSPSKSSSFTSTPNRKRSVLIKKLTDQNKKYLQHLKGLDNKLANVVNKRIMIKNQTKLKQQTTQISRQLKLAYKQIDTLKKQITDNKTRQIPIDKKSKIIDLQNQIKILQSQSKQLKQQINTSNQIKKYQQQQINKILTTQTNSQISILVSEIQQQKQILKKFKKDTILLQQSSRRQHEYMVQLQTLYNKLNQNKHQNIMIQQQNTRKVKQFTEEKQQQQLKLLISQVKQKSRQCILNIQIKKKQNIKIVNSNTILQRKVKEKNKQMVHVQKKYHSILNQIDTKTSKNKTQVAKQNKTETLKQNKKSITIKKYSQHTKVIKQQYKNNTVSYNKQNVDSVGQKLDNCVNVSDHLLFSTQIKSIDIMNFIIWISKQNEVCGLQAIYQLDGHQYFQGDRIGYCKKSQLRQVNIDLKFDKIKKINGSFNKKGFISSLNITMVSEKQMKLGKQGIVPFELYRSESQIQCLEGSFISKIQGASICQLGCSFKSLKK